MKPIYHYFLLQDKSDFYRVGIEGDKSKAEDYFSQYFKVEYIDNFPLLISGDIDEYAGVGNKVKDGFIIRTYRFIYQMRSQQEEFNYFSYIKSLHQFIKAGQEALIKEKEERKRKKVNK